jgi:hypothetical protein
MDRRTKRAWAGLVRYANADPIDVNEFQSTLADCMPWVSAFDAFGLLGWLSPIHDEELLRQATEYQPSVKALLRWLAVDPKSQERPSLQQQASSFLQEHSEHIGGTRLKETYYDSNMDMPKFNYTPAELEQFKAEYRGYSQASKDGDSLLGILAPGKDYKDVADPICDFILSEYQKYRNREYSRKDKTPPPLVTVFVCSKCDKLVMPDRAGRKKSCSECSDQVRADKYRQKASPDENRDYQWLYRLNKMDSASGRQRLHQPKGQQRLADVKARQQNSRRCQRLIHEMRLHQIPQ